MVAHFQYCKNKKIYPRVNSLLHKRQMAYYHLLHTTLNSSYAELQPTPGHYVSNDERGTPRAVGLILTHLPHTSQ